MRGNLYVKFISMVLVIATLFSLLPANALAEALEADATEVAYIKSIKLAQAKTPEAAKAILEAEGYIFLEGNLNEGTGEEGVWMGYTTTTDPTEAIYDIKLMNMKGGYTLTSMKEALAAQQTAFAEMAADLNYLVEAFVSAYED